MDENHRDVSAKGMETNERYRQKIDLIRAQGDTIQQGDLPQSW